jgi:hypothetical protein
MPSLCDRVAGSPRGVATGPAGPLRSTMRDALPETPRPLSFGGRRHGAARFGGASTLHSGVTMVLYLLPRPLRSTHAEGDLRGGSCGRVVLRRQWGVAGREPTLMADWQSRGVPTEFAAPGKLYNHRRGVWVCSAQRGFPVAAARLEIGFVPLAGACRRLCTPGRGHTHGDHAIHPISCGGSEVLQTTTSSYCGDSGRGAHSET